jgi:hypothetical protein
MEQVKAVEEGSANYSIDILIGYLKGVGIELEITSKSLNNDIMKEMTFLTNEILPTLEGKVIAWSAPAYSANTGFWGPGMNGGYAAVIGGELKLVAGDDPKYMRHNNDGTFNYSDRDRTVGFKVVENVNTGELLEEGTRVYEEAERLVAEGEAVSRVREIGDRPMPGDLPSVRELAKAREQHDKEFAAAYAIFKKYDERARAIVDEWEARAKETIGQVQ